MAALRPLALRYSARSRLHLLAIHEHIAHERDSAAAIRIGRAIREAVELLTYFPRAGRRGRSVGTREWVVRQLPYVVVYELVEGESPTLTVLGVFHAKQDRD